MHRYRLASSHEWEGEGGILEMAAARQEQAAGNWIKPKGAHGRMVNRFSASGNVHLDFLPSRSREARRISGLDDRGKVLIKSAGWQPICEKRFHVRNDGAASLSSNQVNPAWST